MHLAEGHFFYKYVTAHGQSFLRFTIELSVFIVKKQVSPCKMVTKIYKTYSALKNTIDGCIFEYLRRKIVSKIGFYLYKYVINRRLIFRICYRIHFSQISYRKIGKLAPQAQFYISYMY